MRLPNGDRAAIDPQKITGYLLSVTHPVGRSKARFFRGLGFSEATAGDLERALLEVAKTGEVVETIAVPYGTKFVVDGTLRTPAGAAISVRTVWVVETGQSLPRFVTAYPA